MRRALFCLLTAGIVMAVLAMSPTSTWAKGDGPSLRQLAEWSVNEKPEGAQYAIKALRDKGPAGLEALIEFHRYWIDKQLKEPGSIDSDPTWQRVKVALDAVGAQRDCYASRLYWYTDFDAAKAAAKKSRKPILSLRLLGNLTDEFSCANSRFFRTTLYANEEVSKELRDRFILHWQSVRPVPKVTIDFGDGRKLERTLTGNSVHYVLDRDGRVIDALPGLYGPKAFLQGIRTARVAVFGIRDMNETDRAKYLSDYHIAIEEMLRQNWQNDLANLGLVPSEYDPANDTTTEKPTATAANNLASAKRQVETIVLAHILADASELTAKTDDAVWGRIAQLHRADAELDQASIALIRSQHPTAHMAAPLTASKARVEDPLLRIVNSFQHAVAIDTVRNEYTMRRPIHEWLSQGGPSADADVDALNERVYTQLFLTPSSDPWLGLISGDVYTALENNGVTQSSPEVE